MSDTGRHRVNQEDHAVQQPRRALLAGGAAWAAGGAGRAAARTGPMQARWQVRAPPRRPAPPDPRPAAFFRALADLQSGRRQAPVVVLQIGDSHTANDGFSGALRTLFQARFGGAGRGVLPAGIPYAYFRPAGVRVSASGWQRYGGVPVIPGHGGPPPGLIGLAGVRMHATAPAAMTYEVDAPADLQRVAIEVLQQPGGGTLHVDLDGTAAWIVPTGLPRRVRHAAVVPAWVALPSGAGARTMTLRTIGDGPVDVLAVDLRRAAPGVIWANLGVVGAQVDQVLSWDPAVVAADLAYLRPDLIVLAYGTNEGFSAAISGDSYQATYRAAARRLAAGGAPLAVILPPDGNRRVAALTDAGPVGCAPAVDASGRSDGVWSEPPALAVVRQAQAQAAARAGWFAWDWSAAMGGPCSMARWVTAVPPLAWPDHVHLREPGDAQSAAALFSALMTGYARSRTAHGP